MSASTFGPSRPGTCTPSRAARELGLKRSEFDLAVHLGRIRTVPDEGGGGSRRVERAEIDRLRAQDDFPESLRKRVQVVGTAEGAALMDIPAGRFSRLARLGLLVPVMFYLNRYRAVVWLYLAEELSQFAAAAENGHLLKGRTPETLRSQLAAGVDLRARNWRGRHLGFLLRQADDPWARAGAVAALLAPVEVAGIVKDPHERAHLNRFRPAPPGHGVPGSPAAHLAEQIMTAQDADEIGWLRSDLARSVEEARGVSPAPRPAAHGLPPAIRTVPRPIPPMARTITGLVGEPTAGRPTDEVTKSPESAAWSPDSAARSAEAAAPAGESEPRLPEPRSAESPLRGVEVVARGLVLPARSQQPATPLLKLPPPSGESAARGQEPVRRPAELPGRRPELAVRTSESCGRPSESAARPAAPPVPREYEPAEPARPAPPRSSRGLRSWLRRRSPRPARPAGV